MREKLLADWQYKYDRLSREIEENQSKLGYIMKRQQRLKTDIKVQVLFSVISIIVIAWLYSLSDDVEGGSLYGMAAMPLFQAVLFLMALIALVYNVRSFIRQIYDMIYHHNGMMEINYPKPEVVRENYPQHVPRNIYEELMCVEWLQEQYKKEQVLLLRMKASLETASEEELPQLKKELDEIIFYQKVKRAQRR